MTLKRITGYILLATGSWMLVSPQALTGLNELKWMHKLAFPGEVILGMVILCLSYFCLGFTLKKGSAPPEH